MSPQFVGLCSNLCCFGAKSVLLNTGQKKFTQTASVVSPTNIGYGYTLLVIYWVNIVYIEARDVLSLPPPSAIGARKGLFGPCHCPERNIDYSIF